MPSNDYSRSDSIDRRRFLQATGGFAAAAVVAGCGGQQPAETPTEAEEPTPTPEETPTETEEPTPTPQPELTGVQAVDDKTLRIELEEPFHAALEMLAYSSFSAVPEGIVGDLADYEGEMDYETFAQSNPIGAGPYQFEDWTQGTSADISAFADYHGAEPSNAGVHWDVIEDDNAAYNHAMNQNVDVFGLPTAQYDPGKVSVDRTDDLGRDHGTYGPLRNDLTANYLAVPLIVTFYLGFNMAAVPKPVRQAFAYATDQQLLVNEVFKQRGEPAYHFTPPTIFPGGGQAYTEHARNEYPYGYNESQLDQARQVMEDAGYGPDNQFGIQWTQYESNTWREMAQILRDQLASAHIDMQIEQAPFSTLIQRGRQGNLEVYTLGWIADWPAPDNFLQLLNPPQTDTSQSAPISYTNWTPENGDAAEQAASAYETVANNPQPTDQAGQARANAYVQIEEANWEDVGFLNIYHSLGERFWYDWVDIEPSGGMGGSRQKYHDVEIAQNREPGAQPDSDATLRFINATITTIDPVAATDTASGTIIQNVFDALMNYRNGEASVENLLAADFTVSDDFRTYEFTIKDDAQFHDGTEVTAQDFVYAFERLAFSENSRRSYFILDSLGVRHS